MAKFNNYLFKTQRQIYIIAFENIMKKIRIVRKSLIQWEMLHKHLLKVCIIYEWKQKQLPREK